MKIEKFIHNHLAHRLARHKTLVVYDPAGLYRDIVCAMGDDQVTVVDGTDSTIIGREKAMEAWCKIGRTDDADLKLAVYLPMDRPSRVKDRQRNPYQIFSLGGGEFPDGDGESFQALCRQAAPDLAPQIDKLFEAGLPEFETVNNLIAGGLNWPKLKTLLGAESAAEILVAVMAPSEKQKKALSDSETWVPEFRQFLKTVLDFPLKTKSNKWATVTDELWRFILVSEFALDLPRGLPESLKDVPRANKRFSDLIFSVCDRLRCTEPLQHPYMEMAYKVASDLKLESILAGTNDLGMRDTFAFEERVFLKVYSDALDVGDSDRAGDIVRKRSHSIWVHHISERHQLWTVAERALNLIIAAGDIQPELSAIAGKTDALFDFYCERFRRVDRLHRDFEQAVTDAFGAVDVLEKVIEKARRQYFGAIEPLQAKFVGAIRQEGWPVSGRIRLSEVFSRFVAPYLKERQKVAFFMVDALRYELAVELENELSSTLATDITAVCAQLPTVTAMGMAALMPEADGNVKLVNENGELVPHVKGIRVLVPRDRFNYIQKIYGDRCHMRDLDDLVTKHRMKIPSTTQLLIVKTTDIDQFGEINPTEARRMIPRLTQKIIGGINRVKKLGFERAVIATDHGFILFDDQQAGDNVPKPQGDWSMVKSRCLLGKAAIAENVQVFGKSDVGIEGDFEDYVVPKTFGTFAKGNPYAHEGLSLQECVLPVISIDLGKTGADRMNKEIDIHLNYKSGSASKITMRRPMIEISMFSAMFEETIEFQLEAYHGKEIVGEVAASAHVNAATNLVSIKPGQAIKVPLKMEDDFHGDFEVRAIDPVTQVNYDTLRLKTDYVD